MNLHPTLFLTRSSPSPSERMHLQWQRGLRVARGDRGFRLRGPWGIVVQPRGEQEAKRYLVSACVTRGMWGRRLFVVFVGVLGHVFIPNHLPRGVVFGLGLLKSNGLIHEPQREIPYYCRQAIKSDATAFNVIVKHRVTTSKRRAGWTGNTRVQTTSESSVDQT